ncbi:hypothetical protein PsorP6_014886 [Peronosclerospora sorghi]|uniref:Uncharacterized protein n=1 Tax=Peronosclerospora sorghi TaxID=230839 RepID=A0ACC0VSB6_9STRA|nr:hypothetical protein PsorP6_014886 [Peronosclerospora sorghi]
MKRESTAAAEESDDVYINDVDLETSSVEDVTHVKTEAGTTLASATDIKILDAASSFKQSEVQHMNRLLSWLLSAEEMKRQHENNKYKKERVANEQRRQVAQEMRVRSITLRRLEMKAMQLAQVDILRHLAVLHNVRQLPDATLVAAAHHRIKKY